jgi:hypothetical protein
MHSSRETGSLFGFSGMTRDKSKNGSGLMVKEPQPRQEIYRDDGG